MAFGIGAIATWISGLTMTGVNVRDLSNIPESVQPGMCPILYPYPSDFVTGLAFERLTFRNSSGRSYSLRYSLTYDFLYSSTAKGTRLLEVYGDMASTAATVMAAIIANETPNGAYDIRINTMPKFEPMHDFTGGAFHGCKFLFDVIEFVSQP